MTDKLKFFSQEWCDAAREAVNSNPDVLTGFKDASSFTNKMEFGVTGPDDVVSHLEFKEGKVVSWSPRVFDQSELWLVINGSVATWQTAAASEEEGGKLLMKGLIKFAKGPMSAAIENAGALNAFLRTWGQVPTDWDV
ncbi:hypothetical protein CBI38_32165 (plasmid) [Rhodococcus oxybenzonivorans]|uniref:SCP2 domain-containing protein n=1 Tax=Rhodococcus oxybenzonivorans TaxID=1990687 RepID=A0A2S2C5T5_9NOCA|nr:hypothetical protein [Rhodococcus oxybenzonivorans]AWK76164.1 hypothetical protein CBI38_32165 [Rhodococcus oxybenzonivorans]ELB90068.1 hypothetical protein Rwratislav_26324 [Rhodococcus wratislaviensis IFP 2016]